jgi:hypothetical protein
MKAALLTLCVVIGFAALARADESGPKAGEKVPELKAFGVVGSVEGKEADFAKERKDAPTVFLFVQADENGLPVGGRPAGRFMKQLDKGVADAAKDAAVVAVWLGDKAFDKHKEYLPRIQMSLKFEQTSLAAFDGNKSGPNNWAINSDSHLTAVVVHKGKVVKSFGLTSVNDTDVKAVLDVLKNAK